MPAPHRRPGHPALASTPPGTWNPEAVGKVPGYAATADAYAAQVERCRVNAEAARASGRANRRGVPNGFRRRRAEVQRLHEEAQEEAVRTVAAIRRNSVHEDERLTEDRLAEIVRDPLRSATTAAERAAFALTMLMEIGLCPANATSTRQQALGLLLAYVLPRPARGASRVSLESGLELLRDLG